MPKQNKLAFVTGASAGIGKACAEVFAGAGFDLILLARRKEKLLDLEKHLKKDYNVSVQSFECDVRNYEEVNQVVSNLDANNRNIDVLINNAGLAKGLSKIQDGNLSHWEQMIDTNIKGLLYVSKLIIPIMVENKKGLIINIASIAGVETYPMGNVYCATKSAVKTLSKAMTIDLLGTGVKVCNIDPGLVETEFSEVRFDGDTARAETVYKGYKPLEGKDIADTSLYVANLPEHVNIQEILITPTAQATVNFTKKDL